MTDVDTETRSWADISPDGVYRYGLGRRWATGPLALWVMLNPSTADADRNDQTITRCCYYSRREGMAGIYVVNLFAYRATQPTDLARATDPVGFRNVGVLRSLLNRPVEEIGLVVVAWGAVLDGLPARMRRIAPPVLAMRSARSTPLHCLGVTKAGHPRHPAGLGNDVELEPWTPPEER